MRLNDARKMVQTGWNEIPKYYPVISIGEFVIMPNYFHGTTVLVGAGPRACPKTSANGHPRKGQPRGAQKKRATTGGCP